jgi:hypothetical protein
MSNGHTTILVGKRNAHIRDAAVAFDHLHALVRRSHERRRRKFARGSKEAIMRYDGLTRVHHFIRCNVAMDNSQVGIHEHDTNRKYVERRLDETYGTKMRSGDACIGRP